VSVHLTPRPQPRLRLRIALGYAAAGFAAVSAWLFAQASLRSHDAVDAFHQLLRDDGPLLLAGAALCAAAGWWLAGRTLRRVDAVTDLARSVTAGTLDGRVQRSGPNDELGVLADAMNDMLERLHVAFEQERQFARGASHELRTPLTVMRAELELALAEDELEASDWHDAAEVVLANVDRLISVVDRLLALPAISDVQSHTMVDVGDLVREQVRSLRDVTAARRIAVSATIDDTVVFGDGVLLAHLVRNLLDNAITHNHDGGTVAIRVGERSGRATVQIENSVGADRAAESHGVGLVVADAIVKAHGARFTVDSPGPDTVLAEVAFAPS
jgi:signal transduction histidine kinase